VATGEEGGTGAALAGAEVAEDGEVVVEDFEKKKSPTYLSIKHLYLPDHYCLIRCFSFLFYLFLVFFCKYPVWYSFRFFFNSCFVRESKLC
jgi:hypothetical protein